MPMCFGGYAMLFSNIAELGWIMSVMIVTAIAESDIGIHAFPPFRVVLLHGRNPDVVVLQRPLPWSTFPRHQFSKFLPGHR